MHALARITPYMSIKKKRMLMNAFFKSQFSYCPLVWMFHIRTLNNRINKLHERCLRIIYNNKVSSFEDLLELDRSVSVHTRNLQTLLLKCLRYLKILRLKSFQTFLVSDMKHRIICDNNQIFAFGK